MSTSYSTNLTLPAPKEVWFGEVVYPKGSTYGPRVQRGIQLYVMRRGHVDIRLNGKPHVRLLPGEVALLCPKQLEYYEFSTTEESEHAWAQLDYDEHTIEAVVASLPQGFKKQPLDPTMYQFMDLGLQLSLNHLNHADTLIKLGEAFLSYAYQLGSQINTPALTSQPRALQTAHRMMAHRSHLPLQLDDIAQAANCSPNHLIRLFKQYLDTTPMEYLWHLRISRAKALLRDTNLPIALIAEQCGFKSPYHFSRRFKEASQCTARDYREGFRPELGS